MPLTAGSGFWPSLTGSSLRRKCSPSHLPVSEDCVTHSNKNPGQSLSPLNVCHGVFVYDSDCSSCHLHPPVYDVVTSKLRAASCLYLSDMICVQLSSDISRSLIREPRFTKSEHRKRARSLRPDPDRFLYFTNRALSLHYYPILWTDTLLITANRITLLCCP